MPLFPYSRINTYDSTATLFCINKRFNVFLLPLEGASIAAPPLCVREMDFYSIDLSTELFPGTSSNIHVHFNSANISLYYIFYRRVDWFLKSKNHEIIPFHKFNSYLEIKLSIDKKIYFLSNMFHMHYQNSLREETYLCSQSLVSIYSPGVITGRRVYFGQ